MITLEQELIKEQPKSRKRWGQLELSKNPGKQGSNPNLSYQNQVVLRGLFSDFLRDRCKPRTAKINSILTTPYLEVSRTIWEKLVICEERLNQARQTFLTQSEERIDSIRKALHNPTQRGTGLRLLDYLSLEERQQLFPDLLDLASVAHSDIQLCREAILSLPKTWVLEHLESEEKSILKNGTDEEYRRLLELYIQIDEEVTARLIQRALHNEDLDIQEVGEDFLDLL